MIKRLFQSIFAAVLAVVMSGCAGIPGADAVAAGAAVVSDVLTGPDTDYKNYLSHCRAEVKAKADAATADSLALQTALSSGNEKTQYGATLIMAFRAGQGGPRIACTAERKKGGLELVLQDNALLELGKDVYFENRAEKRFSRQLDADKELAKARMDHERRMTRENNDLLTTLTGDKLEQFKAQAEADSQARKDAAAAAATK
jgi:hypothetical protein